MSIYSYDPEPRTITAVWPLGVGARSAHVAAVAEGIDEKDVLLLVDAMTDLAKASWDVYVEPIPLEAADPQDEHRWTSEAEALDSCLEILKNPYPAGLTSYVRVEEAAHRLRRVLSEIFDDSLAGAVVDEIARELDAVQRARRGDLSGRARQAVALDRADASPLQIAAAEGILREDPFGSRALFEEIEPAAACVAAAHRLTAAATVTGHLLELDPPEVFVVSDDIEATAIETPATVVEAILEGSKPHHVVAALITEALSVCKGGLTLERVIEEISRAGMQAEQAEPDRREEVFTLSLPSRACLLDPRRPARDLLEDLVEGIRAALRLFADGVDVDDGGVPRIDGVPLPSPDAEGWPRVDDEDEEGWESIQAAVEAEFVRRMGAEAAATSERLSI